MPVCDLLVRGTVVTMDAGRRVLSDGFVAVTGDRVVATGTAAECDWTAAEEVGGPGFVVLPGLVNTHAHLVQGCIRSMAEGTTFEERLFGFYYPMTGACDEQRSYDAAMPPLLDLVLRGVTTTVDDHFTHVHKDSIEGVLRAVTDVGIRCRMARLTLNDPDSVPAGFSEDLDTAVAETERIRAAWAGDKIAVTASTIGITYCSPEQLKALWQWTWDNDEQFDIHAPSVMDLRYLAERRGWTKGSFEWLDSEGILAPNLIAAHAQNIRPGEADLVAKAGAKVALVPDMESVLGLVGFDARQYLDRGVTCGIGLDGPVVAYGHDLWAAGRSLLTAQRMADQHRRQLDGAKWSAEDMLFGNAELVLELMTIGGAAALGMDDRIGSLEPGKQADLLLLDRRGEPHLSPPAALLPNLVFGNGPRADGLARVLVAGKAVVVDGEHVSVDRFEAVRRSDALQEVLLDEVDARPFVRKRTRFTWV